MHIYPEKVAEANPVDVPRLATARAMALKAYAADNEVKGKQAPEIMAAFGEKYNAMPESEKLQMQKDALKKQAKLVGQVLKAYEDASPESLFKTYLVELNQVAKENDVKVPRRLRMVKRRIQDSPWVRFTKERTKAGEKDWKVLSQEWKGMSDDEKAKYKSD